MVCKSSIVATKQYFSNSLRNLVVGIENNVPLSNGTTSKGINFDNAATTPPFKSVLKRINEFSPWYSSIHRGAGYKSRYSSRLFEEGREIIGDFVNADLYNNSIIFVKNSTEGINKLSYRLMNNSNKNVILSTCMEHHSNDLPWRDNFHIDYIKTDEKGRLSLDDLEYKLEKYGDRISLVAVTGLSNVTGYITPIHDIARLVHKFGSEILVDGAQLVPHCPVDMKPQDSPEHIDYLVFSAHKMYAPFGIGVIIGPKKTFQCGSPDIKGGGTINIVTHDSVTWADPPHSDEAGSPNVIGVVALSAAIETLSTIGMKKLHSYETLLTRHAIENLKGVSNIELYGDIENINDRVGIIPFNIKGIDHETLANILSYESGIAVRNGCFCAHPYLYELLDIDKNTLNKYIKNPNLPRPGMVRISFGLYNNLNEINIFINMLKKISNNRDYYLDKYRGISMDI